jgi:hypothetical protein
MLLAAGVLLVAPSVVRAACTAGVDTDGDGADNCSDNCAFNSNASQADADGDGEGDACDAVFGFRSEVGLNMYEAPFAWEAITGTVGASTVTLGDDAMTSVAIGFTFRRLNGTDTNLAADSTAHTSICLGSNGWYHLDASCSSADSSPDPLSALGSAAMATGKSATATHGGPKRRYAPFWADLDPSAGGTIATKVIGTAPNRTFVVEFDQVPYADDADTVTFQIRLAESDISSNPASIGAGRMEFRIKDGSAGNGNQRWVGAESSSGKALGLRSGRVNDLSSLRFVGHTHPDRLRIVAFEGNLRPGAALAGSGLLGALSAPCTSISDCVSKVATNALRSSSVIVISSNQTTALTAQDVTDLTTFVNGSPSLIPGRLVWVSSKPLTGIDTLLGVSAGAAHATEALFGAPLAGQFHAFKPVGALTGVDRISGVNTNGFTLTAAGNTFAVAAGQLFRANGGRTYVSSNAFDDYAGSDANGDGRADAVDWTANMVLASLFSGGTSDLASADFAAATSNDADNDGFDSRGVDNCPLNSNALQTDGDGDGQGDACDTCPNDAANDADGDSFCADADNCPLLSNAAQTDTDGDGQGDDCDTCSNDAANDVDGDTVCGDIDNCPAVANLSQVDADTDGIGDACDLGDSDGDGTADNADGCPLDAGKIAAGICGCGTADDDSDGDAVVDCEDNCPLASNGGQTDLYTAGGIGDACDVAAARSGTVTTSHVANRAPFFFSSIVGSGAAVVLADDAFSAATGLPFSINLFGAAKNSVFIGSNGVLAFSTPGAELGNIASAIPSTASLEDFIAGFWTDLNPAAGGSILTLADGIAPGRTFTVEWNAVPTANGAGNATFQIVLFETTGRIEIRIKDAPASAGALRVVGVENGAGDEGITLRGASNQSLSNTRFVIWPQANRPKVGSRYLAGSAAKVGIFPNHLCENSGRGLDSLFLPCSTLDSDASTLNAGEFSVFSFEATSPSASSLGAVLLSNIETFIASGGVAFFSSNRGTASTPALTNGFINAFGIDTLGASRSTPPSLSFVSGVTPVTGGAAATITTGFDVASVNGVAISSLLPGAVAALDNGVGSPVLVRANESRTYFLANIIGDYRTALDVSSNPTGTRVTDVDGDGIGDLVEIYRDAVLFGLYGVDTNNDGIDDRSL